MLCMQTSSPLPPSTAVSLSRPTVFFSLALILNPTRNLPLRRSPFDNLVRARPSSSHGATLLLRTHNRERALRVRDISVQKVLADKRHDHVLDVVIRDLHVARQDTLIRHQHLYAAGRRGQRRVLKRRARAVRYGFQEIAVHVPRVAGLGRGTGGQVALETPLGVG